MAVALLLVASAGHVLFWIGVINRLHGLGLSHKVVDRCSAVCYAAMAGIALLFTWWLIEGGSVVPHSLPQSLDAAHLYLIACIGVTLLHLPRWIFYRLRPKRPQAVVHHQIHSIDIAARLGRHPVSGFKATLFDRIPGNRMFHLNVDDEQVELARLPMALDGLSILHLSDFHFSGRITPDYFHEVVSIANELKADLLAVTGDICDVAALIDWIPDIFGKLHAPFGKFFVLGNHDLRVQDVGRLREAMVEACFVDLGVAPKTIEIRGERVLLAGDERPWFPTPELETSAIDAQFKVLLAHSPDRFAWARSRDFDLMLAGHTHGGQICLPGIGPILCPSLHGIRYADGTFFDPPTLMHVSRGISNLFPLRLLCPPEMTKLVLRRSV